MWRVAVVIGSCQEAGIPKSDRAAIGLAMQRFGGQVHAYCLRDDAEALRYALAAGAATATPVEDVAAVNGDVVLVGGGGAEPWGDLLLALLAGPKQCAMVCEVLDIAPGPAEMTVTRDLGRGGREVLAIRGPAVLGIAEAAPQLLYVSRYRRQVVRPALLAPRTGLVHQSLTAVGSQWEPARPRVKTGNLVTRTAGPASTRLQALLGLGADTDQENNRSHVIIADAVTCARHLLRFLRHHGMIAAAMPSATVPGSLEIGAKTVARGTPDQADPVWAPHLRGPRPLYGERHGTARGPRPLPPDSAASPQSPLGIRTRGPRPVGRNAPQRRRGPRPLDTGPSGPET
jgi:hypothetical protein